LFFLRSISLKSFLFVNLILYFIACRGQFLELNVIPPSESIRYKISRGFFHLVRKYRKCDRSFLRAGVAFIVDVATTKPSFGFNSPRKTDRLPARSRHVIRTNGKVISCESYFLLRSQQYVVAGASHCSYCKKYKGGGGSYRDRQDNDEIARRVVFRCSQNVLFLCSVFNSSK